ncbi:MAG: D-alanyl-D-alanine carboxypeptidase family protein [Paracoccaceae bacterium]
MTRLLTILALIISPLAAQAFETRATAAFVFDAGTGTVLLDKNADRPLPPASMSKLMTLYMTFEALADGRLSVDTRLPVSEYAMSYDGSTMFLDTTDRPTVEELIRGVVVLSGNDATVVLAEGIAGSEDAFARMMTERARQLGMTNSTFVNASGWPEDGHVMSMRDLGILAQRLIEDFPTFYPLFAEREYEFDGRAPSNTRNRNPLLGLGIGADGLKTGHTREAGYGLVGSARQGDRRVIFVITGLQSERARAEESERIVNWAFRQFVEREVGEAGLVVATAPVWAGAAAEVGLALPEDLTMLVPVLDADALPAEVVFDGPIQAPIAAGDPLGELVIRMDELPEQRHPLVAATDVARGGFTSRLGTAATVLMDRFLPQIELPGTTPAPQDDAVDAT